MREKRSEKRLNYSKVIEMGSNHEEKIGRMVKSACKPVDPSPGLRDRLRQRLTHEAMDNVSRSHGPMMGKTRIGIIAASVIISGSIGYGVWLSLNAVPAMAP